MRDELLLYINSRPVNVGGGQAFVPLSDYLRYQRQKTGTKVVCAEGDCGACTVLLGRLEGDSLVYQPVNSCIQYLYQLDCTHVITIEGLTEGGKLNPVQEAMVTCHGAQCGYCTPGMVVAMSGYFMTRQDSQPVESQEIRDALTGNLCRCTGYEAILKAGCAVEPSEMPAFQQMYPQKGMIRAFRQHQAESVRLEAEGRVFYKPVSVEDAVRFKHEHPETTLISGGTDVSVFCNKRNFEPAILMSIANLPGLDTIERDGDTLAVGSGVTLSRLENEVRTLIPELHQLLNVFGSPQIKNAGTLAGNIANGSPIGDTLPFLFVMGAEVELTGMSGSRRIDINQLYTGYKRMVASGDEIITRIFIHLPQPEETLKLYKVSRRSHLDIATFMAAFRMTLRGNTIERIRIAYGGVGPVILRLPKTEAFLQGGALSEARFRQAGDIALEEITPMSDVRGSRDFRNQLARNILLKFYHESCGAEVPV
ncbi:MAG TPA: FAD binding domain-containing protein [Coleofasciculaceae cyanobacterium]|jgi:xanthine dehydrogenase small subunit